MRWLLLLWLLLVVPGWSEKPNLDQLLQQKRWSEAVPLLEAQDRLNNNDSGARLYYNLGLCYQHLNNLGRARVYYQAALRRNPWNSSLQSNLALLKAGLTEPEPDESWTQTATHCAPPAVLAASMLIFSWSACGLAWMYRMRPRERWLWGGLGCFILAVISTCLWFAARLAPLQAVVQPETAFLMNGPGGEFTQSLNVHAGNLVEVVREQGDWAEVEALGKLRAWIRRDELMLVP
ncbi:tetratricopeptide repeat protein [bacterium]|nr:tetratricopeptide repeat protein [bacterium]